MGHDFEQLIDDALQAFWRREPVGATFAGEFGYAAALPRAGAAAEADEVRELETFAARLATAPVPDDPAARIDARMLAAHCTLACTPYARRARYRNPAWYSGEAVFGLISLMLAQPEAGAAESVAARVRAMPAFFEDGAAALRDAPVPAAWMQRAQRELAALKRLVGDILPPLPTGAALAAPDLAAALAACDRFAAATATARPGDAACGTEHLALVMRHVHGLSDGPAALERRAAAAFAELNAALEARARTLDPALTWREQLARLAEIGPEPAGAVSSYAQWHSRALRDAGDLLTPAGDFALTFEPLPGWAREVAAPLYFLLYRSPPARGAGGGSIYWVTPPAGSPADIRRAHNTAAVKLIHAVHHGSIGHHTQNARARAARSRFARIAGTDCASGIALPAGGSMAEGWACYAEDLMAEVPGFYTPAEELQLLYFELRNVASALADIRYHTGAYTLEEMGAFYRDDAAFAPARIGPETTRNSMFPGSRLMYWCGTQQIKALRAASPLAAKTFHDRLLGFGTAPVAWIAEELAR